MSEIIKKYANVLRRTLSVFPAPSPSVPRPLRRNGGEVEIKHNVEYNASTFCQYLALCYLALCSADISHTKRLIPIRFTYDTKEAGFGLGKVGRNWSTN